MNLFQLHIYKKSALEWLPPPFYFIFKFLYIKEVYKVSIYTKFYSIWAWFEWDIFIFPCRAASIIPPPPPHHIPPNWPPSKISFHPSSCLIVFYWWVKSQIYSFLLPKMIKSFISYPPCKMSSLLAKYLVPLHTCYVNVCNLVPTTFFCNLETRIVIQKKFYRPKLFTLKVYQKRILLHATPFIFAYDVVV